MKLFSIDGMTNLQFQIVLIRVLASTSVLMHAKQLTGIIRNAFNHLMARTAIWRFDGVTHVAML